MSNPGDHLTSIQPQTIFKDALYMIYSYLPREDWFASRRTCHHWLQCGSSCPSLHFTFPSRHFRYLIDSPPSKSIRHHFTELEDSLSGGRSVSLSISQLVSIGLKLPQLTRIECHDIERDFTRKIRENDITICWPVELKTLDLSQYQPCQVSFLVGAICQCTTLEYLSLEHLSMEEDLSPFAALDQLIHLKYLHLDFKDNGDDMIDVLDEMKLTRLPPNLKTLNIQSGHYAFFQVKTLAHLPPSNLEEIVIERLAEGDLPLLLKCAPHLTKFSLGRFYAPELELLSQFPSLKFITLHPTPDPSGHSLVGVEYDTVVLSTLISCRQLTKLHLWDWSPTQPAAWSQLAQGLPHLRELMFVDVDLPDLGFLNQFGQLCRLRFDGRRYKFRIKEYFSDPAILPNLQLLKVDDGWASTTTFVWSRDNIEKSTNIEPTYRTAPMRLIRSAPALI